MADPLHSRPRTTAQALAALVLAVFGYATLASSAFAAAMTGTYRLDSPHGAVTATIEVHGDQLTGSIDFFGKSTATLDGNLQGENTASGSISSKQGTAAFAATLHNDTLELTLFQGGGAKPGATPSFTLLRTVPATAIVDTTPTAINVGDKRLIGSWVYRDEYISEEDSAARNEYLEFHGDGTYVFNKSGDATEGSMRSSAAGKMRKPENGNWRAQDGVLYVMNKGGADWIRVGLYEMKENGRSMRISYERGNRKRWTRQ